MLWKHVTLAIALAGFATAAWDIDKPRPKNGTTLFQRASGSKISPDAHCGGNNGYTCQGSQFGNCCSQYGYCGSSKDYCGVGCQSKYGTCNPTSSPSPSPSPSRSPSPSPSSGKVSPNARCGYLHGATAGYTCQGSKFGNCCSDQSYCGSSEAYCGKGCQSAFGSCSTNPKSSSMITSTKTSSSIASSSSSAATSSSAALSSSSSAPASSSSSVPPPLPTAGVLQVYKTSDNSIVGYVSKNFVSTSTQRLGIDPDIANAMIVKPPTIPLGQTSATQAQIFITNPPDSGNPYLCFCVGPADDSNDLSIGSANYLLWTTCPSPVPAGPPGAYGNSYNSGEDSETAVWNIDLITGVVTASWVNTDGSIPPQHNAFLPGSNGLLNVGDQAAFDGGFPGGYPIRVQFVGVP